MPHNILAVPLIIKNSIKEKNPLYNAVIMGSRAALNLPLIGKIIHIYIYCLLFIV